MSFVFYDTETTGLDRVFDQILQFAAIRTDEEFNELDRLNIRCRLLPHIVPSPEAMRMAGVTVAQLIDPNLPTHYAMVRGIVTKLLSWSPALYVGYNSMEFDEALLRQALYQTLHQPYLTNTDNNCRADGLRLARMAALFEPGAIAVPANDEGRPFFKLDHLARANGFDHTSAHDALADAQATIHICRLVSERAPHVWSHFIRFTQKRAVVDYAAEELIFSFSDFYRGEAYSWLVTSLGPLPSMPNDLLVFDLAYNPDDLREWSDKQLQERLSTPPRIIRKLRANACPIIMPAEDAPSIVAAKEYGAHELTRRASLLQQDTELRARLVAAMEAIRRVYPPSPHVEQQIYDGFISDADKGRLDQFHNSPWNVRSELLNQLEDRRLRQLGRRLIYLERPDLLPIELQSQMAALVAKRLVQGGGADSWLCLEKAIQQCDKLLSSADAHEATLLAEHRAFLAGKLNEMNGYLAKEP